MVHEIVEIVLSTVCQIVLSTVCRVTHLWRLGHEQLLLLTLESTVAVAVA